MTGEGWFRALKKFNGTFMGMPSVPANLSPVQQDSDWIFIQGGQICPVSNRSCQH